jgi:hypothetical protein
LRGSQVALLLIVFQVALLLIVFQAETGYELPIVGFLTNVLDLKCDVAVHGEQGKLGGRSWTRVQESWMISADLAATDPRACPECGDLPLLWICDQETVRV